MIKPFDFYFDFGSPYTFLAHKEVRKIEKEYSIKINYMPILLGGILKLAGNKANAEIPIKGKYMIKDCKLWAEKNKTEFKFNSYFPIITLNLMRGVLVAEKKNLSNIFIDKIFDSIWINNINLNKTENFEIILKNLKLDSASFLIQIADQKIKDNLKKKTETAYEKGIFGTPSFMVNNKLFWGQDRLEFVINEAKK